MPPICKKHKIEHTLSFDPNNTFCLECANEPKGAPTKSEDGFRITAAPVGIDDVKYFSVLEAKGWSGSPQYCYLFKNQPAAKKELDMRSLADLNVTFFVAIVSTKIKCVQWRANGMSIPTYAIWPEGHFPAKPNGNHAKFVKKVTGLNTAKKMTQGKLKPKYGGSLNKGTVTPIPYNNTPATPKSAGGAPISMPPAKKVVKKPVKKRTPLTRKRNPLTKTPVKKATNKKPTATRKSTLKTPTSKPKLIKKVKG